MRSRWRHHGVSLALAVRPDCSFFLPGLPQQLSSRYHLGSPPPPPPAPHTAGRPVPSGSLTVPAFARPWPPRVIGHQTSALPFLKLSSRGKFGNLVEMALCSLFLQIQVENSRLCAEPSWFLIALPFCARCSGCPAHLLLPVLVCAPCSRPSLTSLLGKPFRSSSAGLNSTYS